MSETVGEVRVLVRPDVTGFEAEAESGVASAGAKLAKVFAAAFAVGGVVEITKSVIEAATAQNTAFAVLDQTLKDAGQSVAGFSASLHDKLETEARATGVSAEDLAAAMNRLVPATGNATTSLKDLNTAIGISESYHISLSTAALALAKAETGSYNSLQRYLGKIPEVSAAQDALKAKYSALTEAGGKLDASQKAQYASALAAAKAADAQATATNAVALATQKFAGIPTTFAQSYQGEFDRLHVAVDQLKIAIGTELVGGLASGSAGLADYIDKLDASGRVQTEVHADLEQLKSGFADVKSVVEAVGGPVLTLTSNLGGLVRVGEVLAVVYAANKFAGWVEGFGGVAAGETTTATTTAAYTAALTANTAALQANTIALGGEAAEIAATGDAAVVAEAKFAGLLGILTKVGASYLIVNQAIKAFVPGQKDLGLDFSNNTAGFVNGANSSPFQKGSPADAAYQAGVQGKKSPVSKADLNAAFNFNAVQTQQAYEQGLKKASASGAGRINLPDAISGSFDITPGPVTTKKMSDAAAATLQTLSEAVSNDQTDLDSIKTNMADAITQGAQAVDQAVEQAKQNLNQIGQSLATQIGALIDQPLTIAQQHLTDKQDQLAAEFDKRTAALQAKADALTTESDRLSLASSKTTLRNLGQEILLPGGKQLSQDPTAALKQLQQLQKTDAGSPALQAFILQYQEAVLGEQQAQNSLQSQVLNAHKAVLATGLQVKSDALKLAQDTADGQKTIITRQIADYTDLFNKGAISQSQFTGDVAETLKKAGVTRARAVQLLGVAGADALFGDVAGLTQQAGAIAGGPSRGGTGLVPSITRPLDTLNSTTKQIADLAKQQRDEQIALAKASNKYLKTLAGDRATLKFVGSLDHNPGTASKKQKDLTGVTG